MMVARTRHGESWGALGLYRENGRPLFDRREIDFVRAPRPCLPRAPGLVVLNEDLAVVSSSPTASSWLSELGGDEHTLPASLMAVAGSALGPDPGSATIRVASASGGWPTLRGTKLEGPTGRQAAVILEATQPATWLGS